MVEGDCAGALDQGILLAPTLSSHLRQAPTWLAARISCVRRARSDMRPSGTQTRPAPAKGRPGRARNAQKASGAAFPSSKKPKGQARGRLHKGSWELRAGISSNRRAKRAKKPLQPFRRKLHFSKDEVWTYRIGGYWVLIRTPDLKTTFRIDLGEITGMTPDEMERAEWKGWWRGVRPQEIKDYIAYHLRPEPEIALPPAVFLHPWVRTGRGSFWHLRRDCRFLPPEQRPAWLSEDVEHRPVLPLAPEEAAERLGEPLTRRNLCGLCMHRVYVKRSQDD